MLTAEEPREMEAAPAATAAVGVVVVMDPVCPVTGAAMDWEAATAALVVMAVVMATMVKAVKVGPAPMVEPAAEVVRDTDRR